MSSIQDPAANLLGALMDAAALRARVIAANIANQNTPGYRRQVVRFEEQLRAALASGRRPSELERLAPTIEPDTSTPTRADGNNVSLELETSAMRQNQLLYETYAAIQSSRTELLRSAIESGR